VLADKVDDIDERSERRERLAQYSGPRGSMVLLTERRRGLDPMICEVCKRRNDGGIARGVVLDEPGAEWPPWVLWVLPDGWSQAEHSGITVCPEHQSDPLLRVLRFAN
jgi:hypothetical protein